MVLSKNFVTKGLPFVLLIIGGSFALSINSEVRYLAAKQKGAGLKELREMGLSVDSEIDLVKEYQDMKENLDTENWENVRGPRPWEEDSQKYKEIIEKRIKETAEKRKQKGSGWAG